ncbi:hypothetical protein B0T25DRAFT_555595 [Lasiosphaeria hispida]|uniref:Uncharacterized protein n=1 Tax=Lasiosphaeria hispida TaxID=260671 RepID=A0AAJ0H8U1_9PEZI|nr:hypothetical protein B0T25DRAFT_555595 [Lasiosphaeria hispida]
MPAHSRLRRVLLSLALFPSHSRVRSLLSFTLLHVRTAKITLLLCLQAAVTFDNHDPRATSYRSSIHPRPFVTVSMQSHNLLFGQTKLRRGNKEPGLRRHTASRLSSLVSSIDYHKIGVLGNNSSICRLLIQRDLHGEIGHSLRVVLG